MRLTSSWRFKMLEISLLGWNKENHILSLFASRTRIEQLGTFSESEKRARSLLNFSEQLGEGLVLIAFFLDPVFMLSVCCRFHVFTIQWSSISSCKPSTVVRKPHMAAKCDMHTSAKLHIGVNDRTPTLLLLVSLTKRERRGARELKAFL